LEGHTYIALSLVPIFIKSNRTQLKLVKVLYATEEGSEMVYNLACKILTNFNERRGNGEPGTLLNESDARGARNQ
jgi:hypothetical protein